MKKILIVATNNDRMGNSGHKTGMWLEEFTIPYYLWFDHGYAITVASPSGGAIPLDPSSLKNSDKNEYNRRCAGENQRMLHNTLPLADLKAEEFDAVFYPGGHGPLWDLAEDAENARLLREFITEKKLVAAVCHGPAAFGENTKLFAGCKATCFSNYEEQLVKLDKLVPFSLEDRLRAAGIVYSSELPGRSHVVTDDALITGQNPHSSKGVALAVIQYLDKVVS